MSAVGLDTIWQHPIPTNSLYRPTSPATSARVCSKLVYRAATRSVPTLSAGFSEMMSAVSLGDKKVHAVVQNSVYPTHHSPSRPSAPATPRLLYTSISRSPFSASTMSARDSSTSAVLAGIERVSPASAVAAASSSVSGSVRINGA